MPVAVLATYDRSPCWQHDRVRVIYKYALDHIPKEQCQELYKQYTIHEKKYGDRKGIEDVIVSKRKFQYESVSPAYAVRDVETGIVCVVK